MNLAIGLVALSLVGADLPRVVKPRMPNNPEPLEVWNLTLPEAIKIGLDNSEGVRIITLGVSGLGTNFPLPDDPNHLVIAPVDSATPRGRFTTEVMAEVRSIEQQFWTLAQEQARLNALETTVEAARDVLKREQNGEQKEIHGRGGAADIVDAEERLEQFTLDYVTKCSDVITAERQLRRLLGLPPADNRRIVPTTAPTETYARPDGCECLARVSETIDASYQEFQTASRLRKTTARRLDAQRVAYDEGRIPADRYLDALAQYAAAVGQEARFRAEYNVALAAREEARGTLLEARGIKVAGPPRRVNPHPDAADPTLQRTGR